MHDKFGAKTLSNFNKSRQKRLMAFSGPVSPNQTIMKTEIKLENPNINKKPALKQKSNFDP